MQILVLILFSIGVLLFTIGYLWLLVVMFQKSIWWGISQIILGGLPGVVFLFKEWRLARVPFMIWFFGLLSMGGAGLMGLPLVGGMESASVQQSFETFDQEEQEPTEAGQTVTSADSAQDTGSISSIPPIPREEQEPLEPADAPQDPLAAGDDAEVAQPEQEPATDQPEPSGQAQSATPAISDEQREILQILRRDPAELETAQEIKDYAQTIKRQKELLQEQRETLDTSDEQAVKRYRTLTTLLKERARQLRDRVQALKSGQDS